MPTYLTPAEYLPHESPMVLLEKVIHVDDQSAHCQVIVSDTGVLAPFLNSAGELPGWFALELMAQTVGVWNGWHNQRKNKNEASLGMVLGARELKTSAPSFAAHHVLDVQISLLMQDGRFGSFEAVILSAGQQVAEGRINTYQPDSAELTQLFN